MNKRHFPIPGLIIVLLSLSALAGCGQRAAFGACPYRLQSGECQADAAKKIRDAKLSEITAEAVDALLRAKRSALPDNELAMVAPLADLDQPDRGSSLGRVLGEQIVAHLTRHGYTVSAINLRPGLLLREEQGEFALSRQALGEPAWQVACAGTYRAAADTVYVTLKLLRLADGAVLAAHHFTLPLGPNVYALLHE
jgi:TolB-like protein